MRKTLATLVAGAVAAVGISAGAVLLAPTTAIAQEESVSEETVPTPLADILGELVDEGVINQDQADAVAERLAERAGDFGRRGHRVGGGHLELVAELLDMEIEDLADALRDGQSIADLAGDETDAVIEALVAEATERLDEAVADERFTQDEADERLVDITQRITDMVNGELERPEGFGRMGPRGGHGGGSFFGPPAEDAASTNA